MRGWSWGILGGLCFGSALCVGVAWAQGPPAPPLTCEETLNNELFQKGGLMQQLAVARAQLSERQKELDAAKTELAKHAPKPAATPEKK